MERKVELYTRDEAADYLGVSSGTLRVWAHTKHYRLPYEKIGRRVKYKKKDLDAFIRDRTIFL